MNLDYFLQSPGHFTLFVWWVCVAGSVIAAVAVGVAHLLDRRDARRQVRTCAAAIVAAGLMGVALSADSFVSNYCQGLEMYSFWWWAGGCWGV